MPWTIASLAVPLAALVLALRWTGRLESADPLACPVPPVMSVDRVGVLGAVLGVAAVVLGVLHQATAFLLVAGPAWMFLTVGTVRTLSRHRHAARPVVAREVAVWVLLPTLMAWGFGSMGMLGPARPWWLLHGVLVVSAAFVLWAHRAGRLASRRGAEGIRGVLAVVLLGLALAGWVQDRPTDREDVVHWMRGFDADLEDAASWDALGRAARWLQRDGIALPDDVPAARRLREAVAGGCDLYGLVFVAAFDAGLLRGADLSSCAEDEAPRFPMVLGGSGFRSAGDDPQARLRLALARGDLGAARRKELVDSLLASWPEPTASRGLEKAYELVVALDLLGAGERVQEGRAACFALLGRHLCTNPYSFSRGGGFSAYVRDGERCSSDPIATWHALEIMRHVGVPEAVDLVRLDAYVRGSDRGWWLPMDAWNPLEGGERDEALLGWRFGEEYDVALPWEQLLLGLRVPLMLCCLLVLAFVLVRRSPVVRVVPNPDFQSRWPKHMLDAFPELRREEFLRRHR